MATAKVTLSLDIGAISLGRRAVELTGDSLSAIVSKTMNRHLLTDCAPAPVPDEQTAARREAKEALTDAEFDRSHNPHCRTSLLCLIQKGHAAAIFGFSR
ncbi:hypothetical protein [Nocardia sp. NPDC051570]|uniref:hypothetical protein n=1 Tax=Nocardia sp. NPDC051570 TaxID=3364324 RepID=UPI0037B722CB